MYILNDLHGFYLRFMTCKSNVQARAIAARLNTSSTVSAADLVGPLETRVDVFSDDSDSEGENPPCRSQAEDASWPRLLIGIHNIDGVALRNPDAQTAIR